MKLVRLSSTLTELSLIFFCCLHCFRNALSTKFAAKLKLPKRVKLLRQTLYSVVVIVENGWEFQVDDCDLWMGSHASHYKVFKYSTVCDSFVNLSFQVRNSAQFVRRNL